MFQSNPSRSLASLSPDGANGVIDLTYFEPFRGYAVERLELLRSPSPFQPHVANAMNAIDEAYRNRIANEFGRLAFTFFKDIAEHFISNLMSTIKLYILMSQGESKVELVLKFERRGMSYNGNPIEIQQLLDLYTGANGYTRQQVAFKPGLTWEQLHQAIDHAQDKNYNVMGYNDKDHFGKIIDQVKGP